MSRLARRAFGTVVAFILLAGCGGTQTEFNPPGSALPAGSTAGFGPGVKQFGVGLGDDGGQMATYPTTATGGVTAPWGTPADAIARFPASASSPTAHPEEIIWSMAPANPTVTLM